MINPIRIAILEDHSPTLEGYLSRLKRDKNIKVVATATYGEQLIPMIEGNLIHQLILDLNVPNSPLDRSPYHTPVAITEITKKHPHIDIIVISMFNQQTLIQHLKKSGAKGFMLKDDLESFNRLGEILKKIHRGETYFPTLIDKKVPKVEPVYNSLSKRELQIVSLYISGPDISSKEVGEKLGLAASTIRNTLSKAYDKLGVSSRADALNKMKTLGLYPSKPEIDSNIFPQNLDDESWN